ncbi:MULTISPECIES: hypothetical protein [Burkholderia]|uniref:Uncharacterized protein n=1 Tax=Burkholderia stabilis TaxID=95485 RepID=A0AAJ5NFN9_9BURK|nr:MULTISPECIES: hypothetical protein [Burkholderia cepacia complex]MBR8291118.1 hypothetical protein [Burkholderia cenocepacia]MDK0996908.1 hypothetical protein [Burkholderia contaminans]ONU49474.1 hypothetical protein A8E62_29490 [Burkholderia cenocepacia]ONU90670.1 hypothetical protein A8E63_11605 [Burkholderia cenocepacia]VBB17406.1 hypothetical protein BSTAB16_7622 [Burkholderia stabilis]
MPYDLAIWVIYDSPIDLPGRFVARKWLLDRPTSELLQGKTLTELRGKLPAGLTRLPRDPSDDAKIVESWI